MKTENEILDEIESLNLLSETCRDDPIARASIEGQINALRWVVHFPADKSSASSSSEDDQLGLPIDEKSTVRPEDVNHE